MSSWKGGHDPMLYTTLWTKRRVKKLDKCFEKINAHIDRYGCEEVDVIFRGMEPAWTCLNEDCPNLPSTPNR